MDPVTLIVSALAAGAAAGLKPTATQAIKDAYAGLKALVQRKYGSPPSLEALEKKPDSEPKRSSATEDLMDAGAGQDAELLERAKALLDAVRADAPEAAAAVGIDLKKVEAEYLRLKGITARGSEATGVRVEEGKFRGGIDIENVQAEAEKSPKKP